VSAPSRRRWWLAAGALALVLLLLSLRGSPATNWALDLYWESVLAVGFVDPGTTVGPHMWAVAAAPDGRLALGGMYQDVVVLDADGALSDPLLRLDAWVMEVGWSPDGRWFAASSFFGEVRVVDAAGATVAEHRWDDVSYTFAFHPTEPLLATASYGGEVALLDLTSGAVRWRQRVSDDGILFVTFAPSGELLATGEDGFLRTLDLTDGATTAERVLHADGVTALSFSPDGTRMVSGGDDAFVRVWDVASGDLLAEQSPHDGWTNFSTFLPDGRWITVGTDDAIHVWGPDPHAVPTPVEGHPGGLMCVRPVGGDRFATTGKDGVVRVWDAATLAVVRSTDVWGIMKPGGWRWPTP